MGGEPKASGRAAAETALAEVYHASYRRLVTQLYAFTTDLFVKSYIQWNDLDQRVSANVLVGWEYRPGSEIYLVYDESRDRFDRPNLAARNRMLLAKCTYEFRF